MQLQAVRALRCVSFCQAQHLSAAKQRSGQKLTQESKASGIACSNNRMSFGKPSTERSLYIITHSKYCKSYPSAKQRRRGSWRKKARLCYSKEAECCWKLYAAKLTYFIANIAKATYSRSGQKLTQKSKASCIACSNSSESGGKPGTKRSQRIAYAQQILQ